MEAQPSRPSPSKPFGGNGWGLFALRDLHSPLKLLKRCQAQGGGGLPYLACWLVILFVLQYPIVVIHQLMRATGHWQALLPLLQMALRDWISFYFGVWLLSWLCYRSLPQQTTYSASDCFHACAIGFTTYLALWCGMLWFYQGNSGQWLGQSQQFIPWSGPILWTLYLRWQLAVPQSSMPSEETTTGWPAIQPWIILGLLASACWLTGDYISQHWEKIRPLRQGEALPPFVIEDRFHRRYPSSDFADKVLLLEFWAPWCGACLQAMPVLAQLQKDFAEQGLQVIPVYPADSSTEEVDAFLQKIQLDKLAVYRDIDRLQERLHVHVLPTTLLISRDGLVRQMHSGVEPYGTWVQHLLPWLSQPNNSQEDKWQNHSK